MDRLSNTLNDNVKSNMLSINDISNFSNALWNHINSSFNKNFLFNGLNDNNKYVLSDISNHNN